MIEMYKDLYSKWENQVTNECLETMARVSPEVVEEYMTLVEGADRVFFVGVGRVLLSLQAIAKRYNHLGIKCAIVGDITEPAITDKDLLIIGSGSGNTMFPVGIGAKAKEIGAKVVHIGSNPQGKVGEYSDLFVQIPAASRYKLANEVESLQPMTSLFEQCLLLFGDITAGMFIEKHKLDLDSLWQYHANLE